MPTQKTIDFLSAQLGQMYTGKAMVRDENGELTETEISGDFIMSESQKKSVESWISNQKTIDDLIIRVAYLSNRIRRFELVATNENIVSWLNDDEYNQPILDKIASDNEEAAAYDIEVRANVEAHKREKARIKEEKKQARIAKYKQQELIKKQQYAERDRDNTEEEEAGQAD